MAKGKLTRDERSVRVQGAGWIPLTTTKSIRGKT